MAAETVILGIDPGLAHTGWGLVLQRGSRLSCMAYGCIETKIDKPLPQSLQKIYQQMSAVVARYQPSCVGVETVWFGSNAQSAFATGQARGAALAACANNDIHYEKTKNGEFDYLLYFNNGIPDKYYYCFTVEECHVIYHRFLKHDYEDFEF